MRRSVVVVSLWVLTTLPLGAQRESTIAGATVAEAVRALVAKAAAAMGMTLTGTADNIATIEYWGSGAGVSAYHASIDYSTPPGARLDYTAGGRRHIEAVTADSGNMRLKFGWNESEPGGGTITPAMDDAAHRWRQFWLLAPHGAIKAAVLAGADAKFAAAPQGRIALTFPFATGSCRDPNVFGPAAASCQPETATITLTVDPKGLVERAELRSDTVTLETTYADYKDLSAGTTGKLFPSRIVHRRNGAVVHDLTIAKADLDYPAVLVVTPQSLRNAARAQPRP